MISTIEPQPSPPAVRGGRALAPPETADLLIVIVNYRSADLAIDCLSSLETEVRGYPGAHVAIVENASGQDQFDRLASEIERRDWQGWVTLLAADRNGGFAAGNNVAISWAMGWPQRPSLFWLLNPDTLVRPGALSALVDFLRDHPEVGLAGSRLENLDGTPQFSSFPFPSLLGELEAGLRFAPASRLLRRRAILQPIAEVAQPVDWVVGASLIVRREVFDQVGYLDDQFFMYYEEVDLCRRASARGWACWSVPESRVVHLVGQSSDVTSTSGATKRRPRYWFEARKRYFLTHHGRARTFLANVFFVAALASYRVRRRFQSKPDSDPRFFLWDLIRYNFLPVRR